MSKINAIRFINLNYNNNAIRIVDETFQLGGQSTLLSLRNGGGKTVLVQMMTAPFVHKQYRKTKDRPFESYFTGAKPTFILVEWKLDQNAGYCLTGMMVRRSQVSEEESSEPLEIINFISEYSSRCEQDIYNIPLVEKSKNEIILKNFNACKQIFEGYKRDREKRFFYYDMNNSAQSRQYFDKLSEYKIYPKEWENIIRKVNQKESGLSELFADCKNEKELVEKWFVETIANKLNREQDRIKEFQTIIEKYVRMYKDNKSKINRRDTILEFKEDMKEVKEQALNYHEAEQKIEQSENKIASFLHKLLQLEEAAKESLQKINGEISLCEKERDYIFYEKLSMELHELEDELRQRAGNCDMVRLEIEHIEREIEKIEKKLHIFECAKQQQIVNESREEYEIQRQKIEISKKNEEELEPERQKIGGYLKSYYSEQQQKAELELEENEAEGERKKQKIVEQKNLETECRKKLEELLIRQTSYKTRLEMFEQMEQDFNRNYQESFSRNILGDYEPGILEIRKQEYEKQIQDITRTYKNHNMTMIKIQEDKKIQEREKEDKLNEKRTLEITLQMLKKQEEDFEHEIQERCKIMCYLEMEEEFLWQQDKILEIIDHKLLQIDMSRGKLEQEEHELQKEWKKLTSGEVLELPQDFKEMLMELELYPVYGMSWLEKNGYSPEKNRELVRKQPFLPYSLILSQKGIEKLQKHGKEVYTSYPIPLIARETLEETFVETSSGVVELSGISFYLWFNEQLLDEKALHILIKEKEEQIHHKQEQVKQRREEYRNYSRQRSILEKHVVTKEKWDKNHMEQEEIQGKVASLDKEIRAIAESVIGQERESELLASKIQEDKERQDYCRRREVDFQHFCLSHETYQKNKKCMEECNREKQKLEEQRTNAENLLELYGEELKTIEFHHGKLITELKKIKEKVLQFASYGIGKELEGYKDITVEELEARYEAITSGISLEIKELEELLRKAEKNLNRHSEELKKKQKKYQLKEEEWKSVLYNEEEEIHQELWLKEQKQKQKGKEWLWNDEDKKIAVLNSRIEDKKKVILEQCGQEEPLSKSEIQTKDYEADMNQLKYRITELRKEGKKIEEQIQSFNQNITALAEYQDFILIKDMEWTEEIGIMNTKELRNFTGIMRRDYRNDIVQLNEKREKLQRHLNVLIGKGIYQEDYYRKPLEAMLSVIMQAELLLAQLDTTIKSYDSQMEKLAVDIAMIEKEKEKVEGLLEDYIKEVHTNMSRIDNNSTITIRERPIKMLRLQIPNWEEHEGLYRQRLTDYMEELTRGGVELYEKNENAANYFSSRITTKSLYDTVVGIGNIQIKLYKIEEQREYPITWAEVARNSGGEGFLSAFVVLSSLLHYMRKDETDIFADRNEGKVLVMDNPFAQTNAAHLLKPLMDMAKKTNTQLICLSGLGGDSIYSRFDNIYILNLISASLRGGMQYLRGEHKRGSEEEVMVSSQIEVLGQQSLLF